MNEGRVSAAVATGGLGVVLLALSIESAWVRILISFLTFAVVFSASRGRHRPLLYSPVAIVSIFTFFFGTVGYLLWAGLSEHSQGVSARLTLSPSESSATLSTFVLVAISLLLGDMMLGGNVRGGTDKSTAELQDSLIAKTSLQRISFAIAFSGLCLLLIGTSIIDLLSRREYLVYPHGNLIASRIGGQLSLMGIVAAAFLTCAARFQQRMAGWVLLIGYTMTLFGTGSRRLALIPALYYVGRSTLGGRNLSVPKGVAACCLSIYLVGVPVYLRAQSEHGITPYAQSMGDFVASPTPWQAVGQNILFGYPLVGTVALKEPHISLTNVAVALNPLPGDAAGWYKIADGMRINVYTPYAATGELANFSEFALVVYFFLLGGLLGRTGQIIRQLRQSGRVGLALPLLALTGIIAVAFTQYNLRSATRLVYYLALTSFLLWRYLFTVRDQIRFASPVRSTTRIP